MRLLVTSTSSGPVPQFERSAGISVVLSHVPFAYAKKSSPGATVRSMPAMSIFGFGFSAGGAAGVLGFADGGGLSAGGGDGFDEPHPIAMTHSQVRMARTVTRFRARRVVDDTCDACDS